MIGSERRSYVKPMLTPRGNRIVFSSRIAQGAQIFVVNWDGTGLRLADGFALALWQNPADGSEWVYVGAEQKQLDFATVTRFPIDAPDKRELVWNKTMVSMERFRCRPTAGARAACFPGPKPASPTCRTAQLKKLGEGCWTSLTSARGPLFWYFDGAHRNVTMVDVDTDTRWMVNINHAPGFDGAEVFHPRWTNHPRFLAISGPYNQGGANQVRTGGKQAEVYLGRFSEDFSKVEAWARVTNNSGGDSYPDVWIDALAARIRGGRAARSGPRGRRARRSGQACRARPRAPAGRLVVNVRLTRPGPIPTPQAILPYRHALVVNEYEIVSVLEGTYARADPIAQWAIRDGRVLAERAQDGGRASR